MNMRKIYRKVAKEYGVSVEEVKREMQAAITDAYTSYIRGITSGRSLPSMSEFLYICEYLGITPSEFFKEEKETTLTQQKAIDYIYTMTDEDIQLLIGFIERMKHTDE